MGLFSGILGRTARKQARKVEARANILAAETDIQRKELEARTKKERDRAQKLIIRGLRSRRAASYFTPSMGVGGEGSATIG